MRWSLNKGGATKVIRKFLFLPLQLPIGSKDGKWETRWLEFANIQTVYREEVTTYSGYDCGSSAGWKYCYWAD